MKKGEKIVVGDAPGIDRQVQDYLNKVGYNRVEIYSPGQETRYSANKNWKVNHIDSEAEKGSSEWLAAKDRIMAEVSTKGLAVILDEGSQATRNNIQRLIEQNKESKVYELSKNGKKKDSWNKELGKKKDPEEEKSSQSSGHLSTKDMLSPKIAGRNIGYALKDAFSPEAWKQGKEAYEKFMKNPDGVIEIPDYLKKYYKR